MAEYYSIFALRSNTSLLNHYFLFRLVFNLGYRALRFASMTNLDSGPRFAEIWYQRNQTQFLRCIYFVFLCNLSVLIINVTSFSSISFCESVRLPFKLKNNKYMQGTVVLWSNAGSHRFLTKRRWKAKERDGKRKLNYNL